MDLSQPDVERIIGMLYLVAIAKDKEIADLKEQLAAKTTERPLSMVSRIES